jgi:hypothetical protein
MRPGETFQGRYQIVRKFAEQGSGGTVYLVKKVPAKESNVVRIFLTQRASVAF